MNNDTVLFSTDFTQHFKQFIAQLITEMFLPEQRIAESQPCGDSIVPHQLQDRTGIIVTIAGAAAAKDAIGWGAVNRTDLTPIVKPVPMRTIKRQKGAVKIVKFKKAGEMVICDFSRNFIIFYASYADFFIHHIFIHFHLN